MPVDSRFMIYRYYAAIMLHSGAVFWRFSAFYFPLLVYFVVLIIISLFHSSTTPNGGRFSLNRLLMVWFSMAFLFLSPPWFMWEELNLALGCFSVLSQGCLPIPVCLHRTRSLVAFYLGRTFRSLLVGDILW